MLYGGVAIFAATSVALLLAFFRPRAFGARPQHALVVWGGLILPSFILAALLGSAFALGERLLGGSGSPPPLQIEAVSQQWWWEFRYPDADGLVTRDVLHVPAGREIEFTVTSVDVIHSFWIPRLGGKIDAIPGHRNTIILRADAPGTYGGVCAEFCGVGHSQMRFRVVAHPEDAYQDQLAGVMNEGSP